MNMIKFARTRSDAIVPQRMHPQDVGFDLTIVDKSKTIGQVTFYNTGIKAVCPDGYYLELVPRSSISKTGYMLANSIGVIDPNYTGEILVALRKVDHSAPDLDLPCRIAQLIPRLAHLDVTCDIIEESSMCQTDRGSGGFGST